jgi:hypothetical protein
MGRCVRSKRRAGGEIVTLLLDPKIFNYVILVLYGLNVIRWAWEGSVADVCYWSSAAAITATVTFLYER